VYYYILDLGNKEIVKLKEKMEVIMASYGISGDFGKISPLSSAYELAKRAAEEGYSTVVAIGGSEIINQTAAALANTNTTLGIIPVGATELIYDLIGTSSFKEALEILRTRKVETIDLGKVSENKYFLTEAKIQNPHSIPTILDFGEYKIGGEFQEIVIANGNGTKNSFQDGVFSIKIDQAKQKRVFWNIFKKPTPASLFYQEKVTIEAEQQCKVSVDNEIVAKTPCTITLVPLALKIIVARLH